MLDLLLNVKLITGLLVALAILTPLVGWTLRNKLKSLSSRQITVLMLLGPIMLGLWGYQALMQHFLGFDSVAGFLLLIASAIALGAGLGWWLRVERR